MSLPSRTDTVVIGAGHNGLAMSRLLTLGGRDHVVIERRETLGGGWQDRWDAFRLVSPTWSLSLPGQPFDGADPRSFKPRDEVVAEVRRYAETVKAPVVTGTEVTRVAAHADATPPIGSSSRRPPARSSPGTSSSRSARSTRRTSPRSSAALPARVDAAPLARVPPRVGPAAGRRSSSSAAARPASSSRRSWRTPAAGSTCRSGRPSACRGGTAAATSSSGWASIATRGPRLGVTLPTLEQLPEPARPVRRQRGTVGPQGRALDGPPSDGGVGDHAARADRRRRRRAAATDAGARDDPRPRRRLLRRARRAADRPLHRRHRRGRAAGRQRLVGLPAA